MLLSENIRIFREKKRMRVVELAAQLGVTKQSVYAYERGENIPGQDVLEKMAQIFEVTIADLYGDKKETPVFEMLLESRRNEIILLTTLLDSTRSEKVRLEQENAELKNQVNLLNAELAKRKKRNK